MSQIADYLTLLIFRSEVLDLLLDRSNNDPDEQVRKFAEEQLTIWRSR